MADTILLVDDEASVRQVMRPALQSGGYTVLDAATYEDALRTSERYEGVIALMITDISLPGNNGYELAAQVLAARPQMKVIFTSGQAGRELCKFYNMAETDSRLLKKPFGTEELLRRVESMIGPGCAKKGRANCC
ncbi:MAG TPA: response regulator [Bryobacteraceae bacterium]|nr:response regulator [Bryobacteraceae bacterium]